MDFTEILEKEKLIIFAFSVILVSVLGILKVGNVGIGNVGICLSGILKHISVVSKE